MGPTHRTLAQFAAAILVTGAAPSHASEYIPNQIICRLAVGASVDDVLSEWNGTMIDVFPGTFYYLMYVPGWTEMEALAALMEADPLVSMAEPNYVNSTPEALRQMVVVAVGGGLSEFEDQQATTRIGLDAAHGLSRGSGQTIAILDTGVDGLHGAFRGKPVFGRDFIDGDLTPFETANGVDDDGDGDVDEGFGHGTMVAGIAGLVAPDANFLVLRVLDDEGRGDLWTIASAFQYAIEQGVDVINVSLGAPQPMATLAWQVANARNAGITVVAAAGNNGTELPPFFPAADPNALMITAVDSLDVKAGFADWHALVFASAPGTGIRSAYPGDTWALGDGCSFATPFVAGEAALVRSADPSLSVSAVDGYVSTGVTPIDELPGNLPYAGKLGTGRVYLPDAIPAVVAVPGASGPSLHVTIVPNPVFRSARIEVSARGSERFDARVYDTVGRHVTSLTGNGPVWRWDGRRADGEPVATGVYFVRLDGDQGTRAVRSLRILR